MSVEYNLGVLKHLASPPQLEHILIWGYWNILSSKSQTRKIVKIEKDFES